MQYKFHAYGHANIRATHKTTLEFTKDAELTLNGDCIVGVNADFDLEKIKALIKNSKNGKITLIIETTDKKIKETINAELNPGFNSNKEMVIRKTDFLSERTLLIRADKASFELKRDLIEYLKQKQNKITVILKAA